MRSGTAVVMAVLAGLLGAAGGFAYGQRQGLGRGLGLLGLEASSNLSLRVETASRIRVGDTEGALSLLDDDIDAAVLISARSEPRYQPVALGMAKIYRSVVPPSGPDGKQVAAILESVEAPVPGALLLCARSGRPCESASGLLELSLSKEAPRAPR